MTSRRSSGSIRAESAVEPTRSENITVTWRRSAVSTGCDVAGGAAATKARGRSFQRPEVGNGAKQFAAMPERRNANLFEVLIGQVSEDREDQYRSRQSAARTRTCRAFRASPRFLALRRTLSRAFRANIPDCEVLGQFGSGFCGALSTTRSALGDSAAGTGSRSRSQFTP